MGEVYRARDVRLGREVAIKVLAERFEADEGLAERFLREARAVAALSHPNILAIHDVSTEGERSYFVTELLEGETLRARLTGGALPGRKALEVAIQIVEGLAAAHEQGVVHRDLKPENVFLTRDGRVKILDFGLARVAGADPENTIEMMTKPGTVMGTVGYMSPEQVRGLPADHRSDIFSFGAVLYEMISGRRAFRRESAAETMTAILHEDPPELSRVGRQHPELSHIVAHCLEKSREERFQTARDLAFALRVAEREERSGAPTGPTAAAGVPAPAGPSIAVLPFRNLSAEADNEYLSDGITEEIIGALTRLPSLSVASRTSSFAFKGKDEDVRRIGERLGVTAVLEGSVRRAGSRIRVAAQLVDVRTGYHLWSERYDRQMQDVFDLQDELARAIAGTLQVKLLAGSDAPLVTPATGDVEAYNHYLKGRYFFNRREAKAAISEFEEAIARDPEYVPAHTGIADSYCVYGFYGGIDTRVAFARARAAADRAKQLAPSSPETHLALAIIEHYYGWDLAALERECQAAIAAAPGFAAAHSWLSLGFTVRGSAAHRENAMEACRLEPFSANFQANVGWTYFHIERDFARALTEFRRALAIEPDALYPLWGSAWALRLLGEHDESLAAIARARALAGDQSFYVGFHGALLAAAGRRDEAREILASLDERARHEYVAPLHLVALHGELGDIDAGLHALERAFEERNALAYWAGNSAIFDPLRADPRFLEIVARGTSA